MPDISHSKIWNCTLGLVYLFRLSRRQQTEAVGLARPTWDLLKPFHREWIRPKAISLLQFRAMYNLLQVLLPVFWKSPQPEAGRLLHLGLSRTSGPSLSYLPLFFKSAPKKRCFCAGLTREICKAHVHCQILFDTKHSYASRVKYTADMIPKSRISIRPQMIYRGQFQQSS